jgi:hypothetical protein
MTKPIEVWIDWSGTGYTVFSDNVTSLVRPLSGAVTAEYGRDQSTALAPTVSGRGNVTLDNRDRRFSPRNVASPLYGKVKPSRPVRITRTTPTPGTPESFGDVYGDTYFDTYGGTTGTVTSSATTFTLFTGYTDDSPINPDIDSRTVTLSLVDALARFRGQTITTPLYMGVRSGQAINYILDAAGWPANLRDIDPGGSIFPWWWEDNTDALTAMDKVLRSEGPPSLLTMGPLGEVIYRDRHHRLIRPNSITSQSTWRGSGPLEPVMARPFIYDEAWRNIINTATVNVEVKGLGPVGEVWNSDAVITLSDGETKLITASTSSPFYGAITPVSGTDYTGTGVITTSLLRTSGASATIVAKAVGGPAKIATMRLRAQPLVTEYTQQITAVDPDSVDEYGPRAMPEDLPWCGVEDAKAITAGVVALRAQPLPIVSVRFVIGKNTSKAVQLLPLDLSDRVHIIESELALNDDFYIESIRHELTGEDDHAITFGLEAVPTNVSPVFRFDASGQGFNQGKFGSDVDDPASIFIFDVAGRGFSDGLFAH